MRNPHLRKEWEKRIREFETSGLSGAAWCAANKVNLHQFYYWMRQFKSNDSHQSSKWLSVEVSNPSNEISDKLFVHIGEMTIEVKQGYNPDLLLNVIQTLKSL